MPKFYKNGFEEFGEELAKKLEDALLDSKPYCVAAEGDPVFEDIGGVGAYCDFYFDPKSMKANRVLSC